MRRSCETDEVNWGSFLGGWVELHGGIWEEGVGWCFMGNCELCSQLPSYEHTAMHSQHASRSLWVYIYIYIYASLMCTVHVNRLQSMFRVTCVRTFVWLCMSLCNDCAVVNKQKQALALMKGCCHLFCRSATIRVPCGSSDRLFFCITLNLRVRGH